MLLPARSAAKTGERSSPTRFPSPKSFMKQASFGAKKFGEMQAYVVKGDNEEPTQSPFDFRTSNTERKEKLTFATGLDGASGIESDADAALHSELLANRGMHGVAVKYGSDARKVNLELSRHSAQLEALATMVQSLLDGQRRIEAQLGIVPAETVVEGSTLDSPSAPLSLTSLGALPPDSEDGQPPSAPSADPETQRGSPVLRV